MTGITIDWKNEQKAASDTKETTYNNDEKFGIYEYDLMRTFSLDFSLKRSSMGTRPQSSSTACPPDSVYGGNFNLVCRTFRP